MTGTFHVRIAGLVIRVETPGYDLLRPGDDHAPFVVEDLGEPDMRVTFSDGREGWPVRGRRLFSGHDVVEVHERLDGPGKVLVIGSGARLRCESAVSEDWSDAGIRIAPWERPRTLQELPRAWEVSVTTRLALTNGGFLVHAAGVLVGGLGGVLLPASSGRGKSTLAAHHSIEAVLSDERVAVAPGPDGAPWLHGTPWRGTAGRLRATSAPLRAVAFLGPHEGEWAVHPLPRAEVFRRLAFHAFPPFWEARAVERTLDLAGMAAHAVPGFELRFVPGADAPERLREVLMSALGS